MLTASRRQEKGINGRVYRVYGRIYGVYGIYGRIYGIYGIYGATSYMGAGKALPAPMWRPWA